MKKNSVIIILLLISINILAQKPKPTTKPKLIVGLVIDQMRYDYLYRYAARYGNGGFKRLMQKGFNCEQTFLNYIPSVTAAGHSSIYTGSVPAFTGIAGNDWYDNATHKNMYCVQDNSVSSIGTTSKAGMMSPKNMLATTITDELRLATNFRAKTIAISLKDRGSILPGGHTATASFWLDDSIANFISSSFYMQNLPDWVSQFNAKNLAKKYLQQEWNTLYPINTYIQSTSDENAYEGKNKDEKSTTFQHIISAFTKPSEIKRTPFGNTFCLDFAKEAIVNYNLGKGAETDFLAVSLSSTDYIGHQYAPNSIEIEDTYLRLDKDLADFITYLDTKIGMGNYTLFLTADHGAAHNPTFMNDNKIPAGNIMTNKMKKEWNEESTKLLGGNCIKMICENEIWLNDSLDNTSNKITNFIVEKLQKMPEIQYVLDMENMQNTLMPDNLKTLIANGYNHERSGKIWYILKPAFLEAYKDKTGTTHGTWNPYDLHIPLLWYGNGIKSGSTNRQIVVSDIAATLAAMLHIQMPNACIGKVITEIAP